MCGMSKRNKKIAQEVSEDVSEKIIDGF